MDLMSNYFERETKSALKPFKSLEEFKADEEKFKAKSVEVGKGLTSAFKYLLFDPTMKFFRAWQKGMKDVNSLTPQDVATLQGGLMAASMSTPGAGVANLGKKEARKMMLRSLKEETEVGRFGLKQKGMGGVRDWIDDARFVARAAIRDLNRTPQKALDKLKTIKFQEKEWDGIIGEAGGPNRENVILNPRRSVWESIQSQGRAPIMHESGIHASKGVFGGEKRALAENVAEYTHQQIAKRGKYKELYSSDPLEVHAGRADKRWAKEWGYKTITKENADAAIELYRKIYDEELGKVYRGLKRDLSPKHWTEIKSKAKKLTEIERRDLKPFPRAQHIEEGLEGKLIKFQDI